MRRKPQFARMTAGPGEWSPWKVRVALGGTVLTVITMIAGLVLLVAHEPPRVSSAQSSQIGADTPGEPQTPADRIANSTLPGAAADLARPGALSTRSVGSLLVPTPQDLGPAGVPTGFPQTPEGAVAQLAAIDQTALSGASIPRAQEVIGAWAAPGGPSPETWSGVRAIAALLSSAGLAADSSELEVEVEPTMVLIKGQIDDPGDGAADGAGDGTADGAGDGTGDGAGDGAGTVAGGSGVVFVVPCLQLVVTARLGSTTHHTAVADCQRMIWAGERWVIGPGEEPAPAPSLWPGSPESFAAGYRWLEVAP